VQINHETADLGAIDLRTALARSCNSFFYELGKRLNDKDPNILPSAAKSFGLGKATDIDFVFEASGVVPSPDWKKQRFANDPGQQSWNPGDATNLAIGQGFLLATPLQMANFAAALANDGIVWKPRLVTELRDRSGATAKTFARTRAGNALSIPTELSLIRDGLRAVVTDPSGTVYFPFKTFQVAVAGKSGTAETTAGAPDAWFVGFASYDQPSVAIATVYEEKPGLLGSQDAATASRAVFAARFGTP
jgi:penicillin-binding protein 2